MLAACGGDGATPEPASTVAPATVAPEGVHSLDRFHYTATLTVREKRHDGSEDTFTVSTEGDFQRPDRHAFTYTMTLGDDSLERSAVIIGDEAWMQRQDDGWREVTLADPDFVDLLSTAFSSIKPDFLGGPKYEDALESIRRLPAVEDTANGVPAKRYLVGSEGRDFFLSLLANDQFAAAVQNPKWELWLAQDGLWPVRLVARATITSELQFIDELDLEPPTSWELRVDISRPNDPELTVAPPPAEGD